MQLVKASLEPDNNAVGLLLARLMETGGLNGMAGHLLVARLSAGGVNTVGVRIVDDAVTGVAFVAYD